MSFAVLGTGHCVPKRVVTNEELSHMVETDDAWIMKRIGVSSRHVCVTETTVEMGVASARAALSEAGMVPKDLDLILGTCMTGETISPGLGCMVQQGIGADCPAVDLVAACSGFVWALDVAAGYFARKKAKKILVVSSERMSGVVDWTDRGTCCIFGDGSGAAVLGEGENYLESCFNTQGGNDVISVPVRSDQSPFYENPMEKPVVLMKGQETYKFAVTNLVKDIRTVLDRAGVSGGDVRWVVPHQANYRIIQEAAKRLPEIPAERFSVNISRYGNTSSASVPILLDELNKEGKLKKGDYIVLAAFGGGLTSGASLLRW